MDQSLKEELLTRMKQSQYLLTSLCHCSIEKTNNGYVGFLITQGLWYKLRVFLLKKEGENKLFQIVHSEGFDHFYESQIIYQSYFQYQIIKNKIIVNYIKNLNYTNQFTIKIYLIKSENYFLKNLKLNKFSIKTLILKITNSNNNNNKTLINFQFIPITHILLSNKFLKDIQKAQIGFYYQENIRYWLGIILKFQRIGEFIIRTFRIK
ncbi:unnamed protein product [Paramecium sonneborni]|uniref:Uncharacterized protein n=1 Tax=Paramecium sonneborni TaxID=65129 RepID=A0A8S1QW17_9CILI|nr:unnamed protein product [Paramecium sonneborni]